MIRLATTLLFGATTLLAQAPLALAPLPAADFGFEQARHLLARAGFGGEPEAIERLRALGLERAVRALVDYEAVDDSMPPHGLAPSRRPPAAELALLDELGRRRVQDQFRAADRRSFERLRAWWCERMLRSQRPLEDKLVLFWHGYFACSQRQVHDAFLLATQNDLLRMHANGSFRALLHEVVRDPAMLRSLGVRRGDRRAPPLGLARAVLERFTVGPKGCDAGDLAEAARAFTGWSLDQSGFVYVAREHDGSRKTVLGRTGFWDGDDVIELALTAPETSQVLARRLLEFFAAEPGEAQVAEFAHWLQEADWQLQPALRALFSSRWFYGPQVRGRQVKAPVDLIVGVLRAMGETDAAGAVLARMCEQAGQGLFEPPREYGWDGGESWLEPGLARARAGVTRQLIAERGRARRQAEPEPAAAGRRPRKNGQVEELLNAQRDAFSTLGLIEDAGARSPAEVIATVERRFGAPPAGAATRAVLLDFLTGADGTLALDLSNRRAAFTKLNEALHLLLASEDFQRH